MIRRILNRTADHRDMDYSIRAMIKIRFLAHSTILRLTDAQHLNATKDQQASGFFYTSGKFKRLYPKSRNKGQQQQIAVFLKL